jgi:hypothetical protein
MDDGSVWDISIAGHLDALNPGYFLLVSGHNSPPKDTFGIDRSKDESPDNLDIINPNREADMYAHFLSISPTADAICSNYYLKSPT